MGFLVDLPFYLNSLGGLAIVVLLLLQYVRTRNFGYLLILGALSVWPLVTNAARDPLVDRIVGAGGLGGLSIGRSVVTVDYSLALVETGLLLFGFVLLAGFPRVQQNSVMQQTEPSPPR